MTYVIGIKRRGVTAIIADMRVTEGYVFRVGSNEALKSGILFPGCVFGISGGVAWANNFIDRAGRSAEHISSIPEKWSAFCTFASKYNTDGIKKPDHFEVILGSRASGKTELYQYRSETRELRPCGDFVTTGSGTRVFEDYIQRLDESADKSEEIRQLSSSLAPAVYCLGLTTMVAGWDRRRIEKCGVGGAFYYVYQTDSVEDHQPPAVFAIAFGNHDGSSIATCRVRIAFVRRALVVQWPGELLVFGHANSLEGVMALDGIKAIFADVEKSGAMRAAAHARDFPELDVVDPQAARDKLAETLLDGFNLITDYKFCGLGFGGVNELGDFICHERQTEADVFGVNPMTGELTKGWLEAIENRFRLRQRFPGEDSNTQYHISPELSEFLKDRLEFGLKRVERTFSDPNQIMYTGSRWGTIRLAWFNDNTALLIVGALSTETNPEGGLQINLSLALPICRTLPAGEIDPSTPISDLLRVVAESFGVPVTAHRDEPARLVYEGPWDGNDLRMADTAAEENLCIAIGGNRDGVTHIDMIFVLNYTKYIEWYRGNIKPILSPDAMS